jgi:hypothetical protein
MRSFLARAAPLPDYQGVNTRFAVRLVIGAVVLPLTVLVEVKHAPLAQHLFVLVGAGRDGARSDERSLAIRTSFQTRRLHATRWDTSVC